MYPLAGHRRDRQPSQLCGAKGGIFAKRREGIQAGTTIAYSI
jgi:hypothetical protein